MLATVGPQLAGRQAQLPDRCNTERVDVNGQAWDRVETKGWLAFRDGLSAASMVEFDARGLEGTCV